MKEQTNAVRLDLFENSWYRPGPLWKRLLWTVVSGIFFQTWVPWPSRIKSMLIRLFGGHVGKNVVFKPRIRIKTPWNLTIGDYSWIGEHVWIENLAQVTIGSHCCISQGAMLLCGNHDYKKPNFDLLIQPISLEDGVWVGAMARVAPGVCAHTGSVLTFASVATSDLEAWGIYQGNPAQRMRTRTLNP